MRTPKHTLSISILKKALTKKQFNKLEKLYEQAKKGNGRGRRGRNCWIPTEEDWERFNESNTSIEEWQEIWDIGKDACLRRLGKMKVMEDKDDERIRSFLGIEF